ncbi:rRNA methyltransferase [Oenococcus oeni S13]|uniref:23S rRNA (pseudouridine(1915)-N(3))-methyltransferase RlmH n=1 Tax=Oenococcus oeni TaxID=1247 RepID=UPI00050DED56|nr:23S rRNA (pseudouridine(1915)-N(3))-methyltransferase RlmH [Oenococcus oeni]KGH62056.1 rRNA methyltransferase [Oenococcus oeni S13]
MLNIRILVVGKIKEKYFRNALDEYLKRLSRFTKIEIIEVKDEATPEKASKSENLEILQTEGGRLLDKINNRDFVIALAIEGKLITSPDLADMIREIPLDGYSTIVFVIGGSLGLSNEIKNRANAKISFGRITLPHQLARVLLTEQIYRSFMINEGSPYHK